MGKGERSLLTVKNGKLGSSIFHFDLPAIKTCPGRSTVCESRCYATHGRFRTNMVMNRLAWNFDQTLRDDFVERMVKEIRLKGVIVFRWHVSGDVASPEYAQKMLDVMRQCPRVRFYLYSRSYRVESIRPYLEEMATLSHVQVWYSCDSATGEPEVVPQGVKLCYLQEKLEDKPERSELVFRIRGMRKMSRVGLPMICPQETKKDVTCGSCQHCWRE